MNQKSFNKITLFIAIAGIALPILWDHYKSTTSLQISITERSIIIEKREKLNELSVSYKGVKLDELTRVTFELSNTGRRPITKEEILSPIYVKFADPSSIIGLEPNDNLPSDLKSSIYINKSNGNINIDFPLLNPQESIKFTIFSKSKNINYKIGGRVTGISNIDIQNDPKVINGVKKIPWLIYPVTIFTFIMLIVTLGMWPTFMWNKYQIYKIQQGQYDFSNLKSFEQWKSWISKYMHSLPYEDQKNILSKLELIFQENNDALYRQEALQSVIQKSITDIKLNYEDIGIFIWHVFITFIGCYYILINLPSFSPAS